MYLSYVQFCERYFQDTDQNHKSSKLSGTKFCMQVLDAFTFWTCYFLWTFQLNDLRFRQNIIFPLTLEA